MICPDCKGTGKCGPVHLNKGFNEQTGRCGGEWREAISCARCDGAGTVPDAVAEWITNGLAMRTARQVAGESLSAAAKRMGITVPQLSAIEHGRVPA